MNHKTCNILFSRSRSAQGRARRSHTRRWVWALAALLCLSPTAVFAESFTYDQVTGTGDSTPNDPNNPPVTTGPTIEACDLGALTDSGFAAYVCSFDGDKNSDGGVFIPPGGEAYRSFRREVPLPGQKVGFENAIIPFGIPVLHPTTGDTYVTAFFDRLRDDRPVPFIAPKPPVTHPNRPGGRQEGVYVYGLKDHDMKRIADTTVGSPPPPDQEALWTDFSNNVVVSTAGAFFVGSYRTKDGKAGQGIYRYIDSKLQEIVGTAKSTKVPGRNTLFSSYRGLAANDKEVFFVGESGTCVEGKPESCTRGVYAYDLVNRLLSPVIESSMAAPGGGTFEDFAVEPTKGIFHHSIATNDASEIVVVASVLLEGATSQGVFFLKPSEGKYQTTPILRPGDPEGAALLVSPIDSFNNVAINSQGEITFTVANTDNIAPEQGLVFFSEATGLLSVFKQGDTFLADAQRPPGTTSNHGGMVAGSQALDSSIPPRIFFRHAYLFEERVYSMMVLATLSKP